MIKTIFFDTSDTLYHCPDFKKAQEECVLLQLSEKKNISLDEAKKLFKEMREKLDVKLPHVSKVEVMMNLGVSRLEMHEKLSTLNTREFLNPDKKLDAILLTLSKTYELGIITNVLREFLFIILDALEIDKKYFKYIVSVDNTAKSKPYPEPFLKAIALSGHNPEECVYVADSLTKDIIPAKNLGMKTVLVSKDPSADAHVDVRIDSIHEVEEALLKIQ